MIFVQKFLQIFFSLLIIHIFYMATNVIKISFKYKFFIFLKHSVTKYVLNFCRKHFLIYNIARVSLLKTNWKASAAHLLLIALSSATKPKAYAVCVKTIGTIVLWNGNQEFKVYSIRYNVLAIYKFWNNQSFDKNIVWFYVFNKIDRGTIL